MIQVISYLLIVVKLSVNYLLSEIVSVLISPLPDVGNLKSRVSLNLISVTNMIHI